MYMYIYKVCCSLISTIYILVLKCCVSSLSDALPSSRTHLFAFSAHKHFIPILQRHYIFFSHYDLFCNSLKKNLNKFLVKPTQIWRKMKASLNTNTRIIWKRKKKASWHKSFASTQVSQTTDDCVLENHNDGKLLNPEGDWKVVMQVYDLTGIYDLKFRLEVKQESFASFFILGTMLKTALEKQQEKGSTSSASAALPVSLRHQSKTWKHTSHSGQLLNRLFSIENRRLPLWEEGNQV